MQTIDIGILPFPLALHGGVIATKKCIVEILVVWFVVIKGKNLLPSHFLSSAPHIVIFAGEKEGVVMRL